MNGKQGTAERDGGRAKVFLIHGWNTPPEIWEPVCQSLQSEFDVTIGRLPGYGNATALEDEASAPLVTLEEGKPIQTLLRETIDSLLKQAPNNAIWCGWSLGATLSMAAAIAQSKGGNLSKRIRGLCLMAPTPCFAEQRDWPHGMPRKNFDRLVRVTLKNPSKGRAAFVNLQVSDTSTAEQRAVFEAMMKTEVTRQALRDGQRLLCELDMRDQIGKISLPASIIAAAEDRVIERGASSWIGDALKIDCQTVGSGHAFVVIDAVETAARIGAFARQLGD